MKQITLLREIQKTMQLRSTELAETDPANSLVLHLNSLDIGEVIEMLRRYQVLLRTLKIALALDAQDISKTVAMLQEE